MTLYTIIDIMKYLPFILAAILVIGSCTSYYALDFRVSGAENSEAVILYEEVN